MSDVKKIDVTNAINSMNEAVAAFKEVGYAAINKNASNEKIETLEIETKIEEEKDEGIIEGFINDIKGKIKDVGDAIVDEADNVLGKYEWYQDFTDFVDEKVAPIAYKASDILVRTKATVDTFAVSLGEGVLKVGEALNDLQTIVRTTVLSIPTGIVDASKAIYGNITGEEWESVTKEMWEKTKANVASDITSGLFDKFYEETIYGQFLKNNSYGFDTTRDLGKGIGKVAGIVGISAITGGTLDPYVVAAMVGFGEGAEKSWGDGASIGEGLLYAGGNSLWEGVQFWVGGKIGNSTLFGESGKVLTSLGSKASTILNSTSRILLDGFDGGAEGFIQPLLASVYKDGYYDDEGNYIEFKESDNILDKYGEIFDDYGGFKNVLTNAAIGSGSSFLGETFDIGRFFNKDIDQPSNINISEQDIQAKIDRYNELLDIKNSEDYLSYMDYGEKDYARVLRPEYEGIEKEFITLKDELEKITANIYEINSQDIAALMEDADFQMYINDLWSPQKLKETFHNILDTKFGSNYIDNVVDTIRIIDSNNWQEFLKRRGLSDNIVGFVDKDSITYLPSNANMHTAVHEGLHKFSEWQGLQVIDAYGNRRKLTGIREHYQDGQTSTFANETMTEYLSSKYYDNKIYQSMYGDLGPRLWERLDNAIEKKYGTNDLLLDSYLSNDTSSLRNIFNEYAYQGAYDDFALTLNSWYSSSGSETLNSIIGQIEKNMNPPKGILGFIKSIFGGK